MPNRSNIQCAKMVTVHYFKQDEENGLEIIRELPMKTQVQIQLIMDPASSLQRYEDSLFIVTILLK